MMKKSISLAVLFICVICSIAIADGKADRALEKQIKVVMDMQAKCWNKGNIDCYMDGYWKSDELAFIGRGGLVHGWQQTLDRYKKAYPDKASMGKLKFELKHVEPIGDAAFVIGTWRLKRDKDTLSGFYTLLWKRMDGRWVIVADHSS